MRTIGITGGIGAGKTQLLSYIREHYNCRIISGDEAAHKLEGKGQPCYEELLSLLGAEILMEDGTFQKEKMAARIFAENTLLEKVNKIVHPAVKAYIVGELRKEAEKGVYDFFFVEAALLIEEHYDKILDELWYIYTDEYSRRERLKQSRGYPDDKITQIIKEQLSEGTFRQYCTVIIDNSGSLEEAYRQIDGKLGEYL